MRRDSRQTGTLMTLIIMMTIDLITCVSDFNRFAVDLKIMIDRNHQGSKKEKKLILNKS